MPFDNGDYVMNLKRLLPLFLILSVLASACGALPWGSAQRTLSVTGTGSVRVAPDIVIVSLGVQTVGPEIARAVSQNNDAAAAVQAAAREQGVAAEDIRTTYFYVSTQQQYDEFGNVTGEVSYWVDNTITVTLRDTSKLGDLLEAAVDAGANSISGVTFSVDDPTEAEEQAREDAVEDARQRAEMLATAAGATLGDLVSISTVAGGAVPYYAEFGVGGGGGVPFSPGTSEVSVQVTAVYELR
jgi:uncharacterized protein YggE